MTGINPRSIPFNDEKVISMFSTNKELGITPEQIFGETTGALGLPEFGTNFVREILKETQPKSFDDLISISGLSHGTDV
jgi:DNA polymerase-3 subunit alpha (Gram-positive type)